MNEPQRDAFDLVRDAIGRVDAVFAAVAVEVGRIVRFAAAPLDRRAVMARIDRLLDRAFGLTQRAALLSDLFRTILVSTDAAAERPYVRLLQRIERVVSRRDPVLWQRVRYRLVERVTLGPRVAVLPALDRTDPAQYRELVRLLRSQSAPVRAARAASFDPQRRWVNGSHYRLSDRVWKQGRTVRRNIDAILRAGIARGDGPVTIARQLEDYLNPERAPMRFLQDGRVVTKWATSRPLGAGHGSVYARALARTEVMRVHGAATIASASEIPGVIGVRWRLSGSHPDMDECDDNARRSSRGLPRGVYRPGEVPRYPAHVNEMCVLSHEHMPADELVDEIVRRYAGAAA